MRGSGSAARGRVGGAIAVASALAAVAWLVSGGGAALRARLEGPEAAIRSALAAPPLPAPGPIPGTSAALRVDRLRLADPLVTGAGDRARVVAVADADGSVTWRGVEIRVGYLGREELAVARCAERGWCVEGSPLPRLEAVLAVLVRRADAFDDADAGRYGPLVADDYRGEAGGKEAVLARLAADLAASPRARLRPTAWQVRIERDVAQVGEAYEVTLGAAPARRLRARLELRDEGGRWRITGGL